VTRRDIEKLHDELEALFTDLWQGPRFLTSRHGFRPNVDSFHTDDPHELTVVVELPGVDPESIAVVVGERTLLIAGERPRPRANGRVYQQMEIEYGPFQRQVHLPEDVDPEQAHAEYERGILRISLPVSGAGAPRGRFTVAVRLA
jgi:HSP20 family protein